MQLFEIVTFELYPSKIMVTIAKEGEEKDMRISRPLYHRWLENTSRLAIPMQFHDDTPGEESAELAFSAMTIEEYYEHGQVRKDLYEYIILHQGENDFFGDALKDLQSVCAEYQN